MSRPVPPPTLLDRVVGYFSPAAALDRLKARALMAAATGGYHGGRRDRRATRNWRPGGGSANADTLPDLPDLRDRSRDLARNTPLATGALSTVVTNVVGDGLMVDSQIDREVLGLTDDEADAWEAQAEREFGLFAARCDYTGVQNFAEMQALVLRAALESGDIFVARRFDFRPGDVFGLKLQAIEADRVSNPNRQQDTPTLVDGIEYGQMGGPTIAYHVTDQHPGDLRTGAALSWQRVPARDDTGQPLMLHVFDRLRPDQARGVPYLAPVIESIKQLGDYADAEVRAAVVSAMFTAFVKSDAGDNDSGPLPTGASVGGPGIEDPAREISLGSGAVVGLAPGEDVTFANPARPNDKFDPFFQAFCRQIGVALELPFELLLKHFTASYSASRAALEMGWQFFRRRRLWLVHRFCQPVYEWVITEAVARGRLPAPGFLRDERIRRAYLGTFWAGPSRIQLDPEKEAKADEIDLRMGTKTREQIVTERTGGRWIRKHAQLVREERLRREGGIAAPPTSAAPPDQGDAEPDEEEQE